MGTTLEDLRGQRGSLIEELEAITTADGFDPKDDTFLQARSKVEGLDTKIKTLVEWQQSRNAANAIDAIQVRNHREGEKQTREAEADLSLGELWVRSTQWLDYKERPRGNSGILTVPFSTMQERAPLLTTTFSSAFMPQRTASITPPVPPTPVLDLIGSLAVTSNVVEWLVYGADPTGVVTAEGVAKSEATVSITLANVTLETVAHWVKYSRQFALDGGDVVGYINGALLRGITKKMEALAQAKLVAATLPVTANTGSLLAGIRLGIATVQAAGYSVEAVALNPADWAVMDLQLLGSTLNGPRVNQSFWGAQPVPVAAVPSGTAILGEFSTAMVQLTRQTGTIYTTDSDISGAGATAASDFRANILTTLAEGRATSVVQQPNALTKVTGTVVAPTGLEATSTASKKG